MGFVASEALIVTKGSRLDLGSTSDFDFLLATTVSTKSTTVFIMAEQYLDLDSKASALTSIAGFAEATTSSLKRMD